MKKTIPITFLVVLIFYLIIKSQYHTQKNKEEITPPNNNSTQISSYTQEKQDPINDQKDLFITANKLHLEAMQNNPESQFELAQIIQTCFFLNIHAERILDDINTLISSVDDDVKIHFDVVRNSIEDCFEFHPEKIEIFMPNELIGKKNLPNFMAVSIYWLTKAAASKNHAAISQLFLLAPEKIKELELLDTATNLVKSLNPDALFGLGGCLQSRYLNDEVMIYTALSLQKAACANDKNCTVHSEALLRNISLTHCLNLSEASKSNSEKESSLQCYHNLDTKKLINRYFSKADTSSLPEAVKAEATQFSDYNVIHHLVQQCVSQ